MCQNSHTCSHRDHAASGHGGCTCGGLNEAGVTFELRPARLDDVGILLALIQELAAYEGLHHECEATGTLLAKHLFGPAAAAHAIIAHHQGTPAGFAVWYPTFSTFLGRPGAFLEDLFVRPHFRRRGLGRRLLVAVGHEAVAAGCARMEWRALKWNDTALGFYRALGAEPLAEWTTLRLDAPKLFALPSSAHGAAAFLPPNT